MPTSNYTAKEEFDWKCSKQLIYPWQVNSQECWRDIDRYVTTDVKPTFGLSILYVV